MAVEYFISYRRKSGGEVQARLIYDILSDKVGKDKVFYDIENIGEGEFPEQIEKALGEASHFILLVNEAFVKEWPIPSIEDDWYYKEIATAIENIGIRNITPVLFDRNFKFNKLPDELQCFHCLHKCQTVKYLPDYAEYFGKKFGKHLGINATTQSVYEDYSKEYGDCFRKIVGDVFNIQIEVHNAGVEKINAEHVTIEQHFYQTPIPMSASSADIDFDKIHFEFSTPRSAHKGDKRFFGRVKFVEKLFDKFQEQHCINIRARGGMGKTSVSYIYKDWVDKNHTGYYYKKHFITVNVNSYTSILSAVNENLKSIIEEAYPKQFKKDEKRGELEVSKSIGHILSKVPKKCLLVIDVNSDDNDGDNKNKLSAVCFPKEMEDKWDVIYLCREKINNTYEDGDTILKNFEDDFDGAKGLFESIYKRDNLDDTQLLTLFKAVFYHPLLIEQLAAYGENKKKNYNELCSIVAENRLKNNSVKEFSEYNIVYKNRNVNIVPYLGALFDFNEFDDIQKYILQHFALWEYDYIPLLAIKKLLRKYRELDIVDSLYDLVDSLVLTNDDEKGFRIHGLLADRIREQNKEKTFDYTDYISTISDILFRGKVDDGVKSCLRSTPIELFAEEKYLPAYERCGGLLVFVRKLSVVRGDDWALDFAYKAELICRYYKYDDKKLSQEMLGGYKDKSSYHVYYDWLETQDGYDALIPSNGVIAFVGKDGKTHSFKMIKVDGGVFEMGCTDGRDTDPVYATDHEFDDEIRHTVSLSDFYIGEAQVTQGLWKAVMGKKNNPSMFSYGDDYPVDSVSWFDCLNFIIELNKLTGLKFRLPTEAQWEFAARGGAKKTGVYSYSGSDDINKVAWYHEDYERNGSSHPIKEKYPNDLLIYDMSGNVFEWCLDWYGEYGSYQTDPQGPSSGSLRVIRGGSWQSDADACRVSSRSGEPNSNSNENVGFRLALLSNS